MTEDYYTTYLSRIKKIKSLLNRPLTYSEKILYSHIDLREQSTSAFCRPFNVNLWPDRIAMQDATAQMALLQFMNAGREQSRVPVSIHCDHLVCARDGAKEDLQRALDDNREVYNLLRTAADKYDIEFHEPGSGIIHQIVLENYAFPGGLMIGTDSHTPNAGGIGMLAVGVGGADAVDVMVGQALELKISGIIGVYLTGKLTGWTAAKDIILKLAGILTVRGGTGMIIEYFGPGAQSLSCTGKATICNMGAELGATASLFPVDDKILEYLEITGRGDIAENMKAVRHELCADSEVLDNPTPYFDRIIQIDLESLEPHINGPFTPDLAIPISQFRDWIQKQEYPNRVVTGIIGSCTNSSYEDLSRAASIARQANRENIKLKSTLMINPGSRWVERLAETSGYFQEFRQLGARILANACGPCIGQWDRDDPNPGGYNSIITSFNRNFAMRNDGNPKTCTFVASPEIVMAMVLAGNLCFNPLTDSLMSENGNKVRLTEPIADALPKDRLIKNNDKRIVKNKRDIEITIDSNSERLQLLTPFPKWNGSDFLDLALLIKVTGKCTTDHISPAGKWLKFRGHLDRISDNLLSGAQNAFCKETGMILNPLTGGYEPIARVARFCNANNVRTIIVGEENYGEGSSREHAAMEPRYLGVVAVLVKSFARIHETNLKRQGVLALTFHNPDDYEKVLEKDKVDILGLKDFKPGKPLKLVVKHNNGSRELLIVDHSYNSKQIEWFKAGSAMNYFRSNGKKQYE